MSEPEGRPRGILTPSDRDLLIGDTDYKYKQQYSDRRRTIRRRIANGILDFSSIQYLLQDKDRKRIFTNPAEAAGVEEAQFHESIRAMLYWVYFGLKEQNYDFDGLLTEAVEEAEKEFSRKYSGKSIDVSVQFDVDVTRSDDLKEIISAIEKGGPVQANRLYDLLEMSSGVPINTSELETVRVWFQSSYPKGEKAVLETMFSEYLGVEVEVKDAQARIRLDEEEGGRTNAVARSGDARPRPREIENYRSPTDYEVDDAMRLEGMRQKREFRQSDKEISSSEDESIVGSVIDKVMANADSGPPSIHDFAVERRSTEDHGGPVTSESVVEVLETIREPFVSTVEIAAACGCSLGAARQALTGLHEDRKVNRRSVVNEDGEDVIIWWLGED
ncbi:hypothetical protein [Halorubrum lipolyticum]|uniref:hypothetical protein n=1 Tax=Halorubrum lipolyticum TaxID=368624 RepID=UPI0011C9B51F|nr:hypothetical protein [Halorubrum lipolyticum]